MKKQKLIILFLILILYSCQKNAPDRNASSEVDVYVAGKEYNGSIAVAKYWKNGQPIVLGDGVNWSTANSIAVVDNDVYVAGTEVHGSTQVAKYWKNGQGTSLTDGSRTAGATSIAVMGSVPSPYTVELIAVAGEFASRVVQWCKFHLACPRPAE